MNGEIQSILFEREIGILTNMEIYTGNIWLPSLSLNQNPSTPILPISTEIVSVDYKENYLICLTANGNGYLFNTFDPENFISLNTPNEHIFKLSFLDNSILMMILSRLNRSLQFFSISLPVISIENKIQLLENLNIGFEDLLEYDIYSQNLVIYKENICQIIQIPTGRILYQLENLCPYYSRNHAITVESNDDINTITSVSLESGKRHVFTVEDMRRIQILDNFDDFLVFTHSEKVKILDLDTRKVSEVSELPYKYYVGKENSVAEYQDGIRIVSKNMVKVDLVPDIVCADLVGIIAVYVENKGVFILDTSGYIRQTIFPTAKIQAMCMNRETNQLVLCSRRGFYLYN
ncbi:hypothetical protein SteCoe_19216 [Stentor coeruleus]|uniref:CNH domain-containing protein n=1 Tax=Stentor coeruleus TaxID=5963 RepID=A0A1R2BUT5_9CILI|nr:hypothetical protein SteCoe_19216 [Stentor coeruleus]